MMTTNTIHKRSLSQSVLRFTSVLGLAFALAACGGKDEDEGTEVGSIALPTDSALTLYCADAGIKDEPCILDDPDNPYALTPIANENKFDLNNLAPSAKARFYLWATAQATSPNGENQYYVGQNLRIMWQESDSDLAKEQSLRAFRSVLDNYFYSITFFVCGNADDCPLTGVFSVPLRDLVWAELLLLFDNNVLTAREFVQDQWGYAYDPTSNEWTPGIFQ